NPLRNHDAQVRIDSQILPRLPPQTYLSQIRIFLMARQFVIWNSVESVDGHFSWAIANGAICVRSAHGHKCAEFDGSPPLLLAKLLAKQLALAKCKDC